MKHYCEWGPTGTQVSAYRDLDRLCSTVKKGKLDPLCDFKALGGKEF